MSDLTKAEKDKISRNEQEDIAFAEQIDRFVKGQIPHFETVSLGHTPPILKYLGAKSEIITIKQNVLRNSLAASNSAANHHSQGHDIPLNTLKQLTEAIRNPIAVLNGQHSGTLVVLTELKNKDDRNIIVPISLDLRSTSSTVNKVTSVYGKDNLLQYLTRHTNDIIAVHKEKAEKLFTTIGYQLPQTTSAFCFDDSIAYTDKNVKPLSEYLTEISQAQIHENKGEITMPVQEQMQKNQQEEKPIELDEKKPTSFEQSGKLLPILETKAEFHQGRIDTIDEKIARREDKIKRNETKIDKLTAKAEKLEDMNKMLKELAGSNPLVKGLIERNERKITEINNSLIPKRNAKIEKHRDKISSLQDKRKLIEHKLDRTVALSKTITSFALFGAERRAAFRTAVDELHKSTAICLNDKISVLEKKQYQIGNSAPSNGMEGLKAQRRINELSEKINRLKAKVTAYEELDDSKTDKLMKHTADTIADSMEGQGNNVSLAEVAETAAVENAAFTEQTLGLNADREQLLAKRNDLQAELEANQDVLKLPLGNDIKSMAQEDIQKLTEQIAEIDRQLAASPEFIVPENTLKNAEMSVEGNYSMIDGIINNGADSHEIAGIYDDAERAADELARQEMSAEPAAPKVPVITAEQALSELKETGITNADFYKSLPKENRNVSPSLPIGDAVKVIKALAAQNIGFSAVIRKNGAAAIATDKKDAAILNQEINKVQGTERAAAATKSQPVMSENNIHNESPANAKKITQALSEQGIPYKAEDRTGKYGSYVSITVSKDNEQAYIQAETAVKAAKAEYINPDFYKQLPPAERFTQRMDADQARQTVGEFTKQGIGHSAVINGNNSAVTVAKKDSSKLSFVGKMRGNVMKRIQTYQQEHQSDKAQEQQQKKGKKGSELGD